MGFDDEHSAGPLGDTHPFEPDQWLGAPDPVESFGHTVDKALRELSIELAGIRAERDGLRMELEGLRAQLELTQRRLSDRDHFAATVRELHQVVSRLNVPPSWTAEVVPPPSAPAAAPLVAEPPPVEPVAVVAPPPVPAPVEPPAAEPTLAEPTALAEPTPAEPTPAEPTAPAEPTLVVPPAPEPEPEPVWAPPAPATPPAPEPEPPADLVDDGTAPAPSSFEMPPVSPERQNPLTAPRPGSEPARAVTPSSPFAATGDTLSGERGLALGTEDSFFDQPGVWIGPPDRRASRLDRLDTFKVWGRRIGTGLVGLVVLLVLLVSVGPKFLPYQTYFVRSGSMSPTFETGDMIVLGKTEANAIKERDIITFERPDRPGTLVTHRVVAIERSDTGGLQFQTKGDANGQRDAWRVPATGTGWKYSFRIPNVGYVFGYLGTPQVRLAMLAIPAVILGILSLLDIWKAPSASRRRK